MTSKTEKSRDDVLRRMLKMPPKRHEPLGKGEKERDPEENDTAPSGDVKKS